MDDLTMAPPASKPKAAAPRPSQSFIEIDVSFGPGDVLTLTLAEGDQWSEMEDRFIVLYESGEVRSLYKAAIRWMSRRERRVALAVLADKTEAA